MKEIYLAGDRFWGCQKYSELTDGMLECYFR